MRITKPTERWFTVPDDPDGAKVKLRQLTPGERNEIMDKAYTQEIEYEPGAAGKMVPKMKQINDRKLDREETVKKSVIDWESFFDEAGAVLPCNPENVLRAAKEIDGFVEFVNVSRVELEKAINEEGAALEKN